MTKKFSQLSKNISQRRGVEKKKKNFSPAVRGYRVVARKVKNAANVITYEVLLLLSFFLTRDAAISRSPGIFFRRAGIINSHGIWLIYTRGCCAAIGE